jgi:hypothetical protein
VTTNRAKTSDVIGGGLIANSTPSTEALKATGKYIVECFDKDGNPKWTAETPNLVVNVGLQYMAGSALVATTQVTTWYIGLYGPAASNTPAATDTMASGGHPGWTENVDYTQSTRPVANFAAATNANPSVVTNTANKAVFTMNASVTIGGAFLVSNNTKNGTTGTLFSAADFQSPGDRAVVSGDILNVTYEFRLSA